MSDFIDKAKQMAAEGSASAAEGVKAVGDKIDDMTGGKSEPVTDKIGEMADKAAEAVQNLAGDAADAAKDAAGE